MNSEGWLHYLKEKEDLDDNAKTHEEKVGVLYLFSFRRPAAAAPPMKESKAASAMVDVDIW